jgi:hypothetical protein
MAELPFARTQTALDVQFIAQHLRTLQPAVVCSYGALSAVIGRDITKRRDILYRACTLLEREDKKVFGVVTGRGVMLLEDNAIPALGEAYRKAVQRKTRRTLRKLGCVKLDQLTQENLYKTLAYASVAGATLALTHLATLKQTQAVIAAAETPVRLQVRIMKELL